MGSRPFARELKGGLRGGWYRLMFPLGYRLGPLPPLESAGIWEPAPDMLNAPARQKQGQNEPPT